MSARSWGKGKRHWGLFVVALSLASPAWAQVTVTVVDDAGNPVPNGFRWHLEEDNSYGIKKTDRNGPWAGPAVNGAPSLPGTPSPAADWVAGGANPTHTLSVNIHRSHAPTLCVGDTQPANAVAIGPVDPVAGPSTVIISGANCPGYDPSRNYMLSILPWHTSAAGTPPFLQTGFGITGRNIAANQKSVKAIVHSYAHPTAQITVLTFEDNQPVNGAYDQPAEHGLSEFTLVVTDPAGQVKQDAFGYPIGTTYKYRCSTAAGRPASCGNNCTLNQDNQTSTCPDPAALSQGAQPDFARDPNTGLPIVAFLGDGTIKTCPGRRGVSGTDGYTGYQLANCVDPYTLAPMAAGESVIRYLPMNKYAIEPVAPSAGTTCGATPTSAGAIDCSDMLLTATLEGTRQNDAWVRGGEPRYNIALGQLNWLVFYGFVHPMNTLARLPGPKTGTISGQVVQAHDEHPPLSPGLSPGLPVPNAYVAINNLGGNDEQVYTAATDPVTGRFTISGVPPGTYQLAIWDKPINEIIDFRTVVLGNGPGQTMTAALGPVAVYGWFGKVRGQVFSDSGGLGFPQGNPGIPNVPVNLRFTDGSLYQSTFTGPDGSFSFDQTVTFWRYLVAEVGSGPGRPTGLTSVVDNGGKLPPTAYGAFGINPQVQQNGQPVRTETGRVVTEAFQLFQDMTAYISFGKAPFDFRKGENGGIRGIVNYATTRTEEDPKTSKVDGWEPGVPNVTVSLHKARQDCNAPNASKLNNCWILDDASDPRFPLTTLSDSWNDHRPEGCVSAPNGGVNLWPIPEIVNGFTLPACAETFKNWDQTRPGVFDGAFAFTAMLDGSPIPAGNYIVQVTPPPGYEVIHWGDRNIEFGDPKIPFLVKPPECVGAPYDVAQYHTLFPDEMVPTDMSAVGLSWKPGTQQPQCDKKVIALNPGATAGVNFNIFTKVPKSSRIWGTVWNDMMLEFNPGSPNASGNLGVSYLPVAIKDWKGTEVARFYTDQWGHFDGLVPANYDIAPPIPLGLVLNMLHVAPNDPGPVLDTRVGSPTSGQWITDPWYNPGYSQEVIRENWEFYSGRTTFIDTIVIPIAAFVANRVKLNCSYTDRTPELKQVDKVIVGPGDNLTITSAGTIHVPNPLRDPENSNSPLFVTWNHGFGDGRAGSRVTVGGTPLIINSWAADGGSISATIPMGGASGQLIVTRGDSNLSTTVGITLHPAGTPVVTVTPPAAGCTGLACAAIQPAIDNALPGSIILIGPGVYQEHVNLWKPVTLQGLGAGVTTLDLTLAEGNLALKQKAFDQIQSLLANGSISIVPGQASDFTLEAGAGILVAGCDYTTQGGCPQANSFLSRPVRIDGLTITGSSEAGGGVLVNGFTDGVAITNDEIFANEGSISGGIRFGESNVVTSYNPDVVVDHNRIAQNGSRFSGGGGVALYAGTDLYRVTNNMICGNFSSAYGGGIGHFGLSEAGLIEGNAIVANESFDEGGGIHVGGENAPGSTALTMGAGSVVINRNLIQGNKAGDDGGGIRTRRVNGLDVAANSADPHRWFEIDIYNNMVVNNSSADHGGGMSFDDTVRLFVVNDTVARNDSTSTGSGAFGGPCTPNVPLGQQCPTAEALGGLSTSIPQAAGITSFEHSGALYSALVGNGSHCASHRGEAECAAFSNPILMDDIIWQNRSFFWNAAANHNLGALVPASQASSTGPSLPGGYWDLAVYGAAGTLSPTYSMLSNGVGATPSGSNRVGVDPQFVGGCPPPYSPPQSAVQVGSCFNVYQTTSKGSGLGNFVTATFSPVGVQGDYHIRTGSPAVGAGSGLVYPLQSHDFDGHARRAPVDIGADQK